MINTRDIIEDRERQVLAPYALKSGDSQGRKPQEEAPRHRTHFQRDRDRILHTTAFRRLEYKTQVFVNHEGDYFRTRLTHTLEVQQIGRTIARALGANEDLVEAICLVHDIGHPPFGHSGEATLNQLMADHGGFDHNEQALRIVTWLEQRYPEFNGLNLTYELRDGIVKHETEYDVRGNHPEYNPDLRGSLEAQIANASDELAYTAHDLDDGLYSGLITPAQCRDLALWQLVEESTGMDTTTLTEMDRHVFVRRLIGILVRDMIEATHTRIRAAQPESALAIQKLDHNVTAHSSEMASMVAQTKTFLYENMYYHYRVVRMAQKADRFIKQLFDAYRSAPKQLPTKTQARLRTEELPLERVICDYIAGMTDRYAQEEIQRLFEPFIRP
ncbi:MAG: deoxyguanosinetriphosphate triphosphohydrolase [Anaerolineae bacterium]